MRIVDVEEGALPMARLAGGDGRRCCLAYVPEATVGDYVLVQHGFAVDLLDERSAAQSLAAFAELGLLPGAGSPAGADERGAR